MICDLFRILLRAWCISLSFNSVFQFYLIIPLIYCSIFALTQGKKLEGPDKKQAPNPVEGSDQEYLFKMPRTKSKTDQIVEGICIILCNISKGNNFLHQGVTNCGFRKLVRHT